MKKLAILLFCLFFGLATCRNLQAQASFMVSFVKGSCLLNGQPLVLGSSFDLQETDKISIAGALVFWHLPTGSTVRMPHAGVWKAEHLLTQLQLAQTSTRSKMVSFILDKLIADVDDINQNRQEYMMAVAASEKNRQNFMQFSTVVERKESAQCCSFTSCPSTKSMLRRRCVWLGLLCPKQQAIGLFFRTKTTKLSNPSLLPIPCIL
ncbi:MAG TPA: hypothetical protein DCM08_14245 [Microscillaceae bacterium]|jgi:hypothetical protein|nr:hypothetical protein [Microscillaceae bacterium]